MLAEMLLITVHTVTAAAMVPLILAAAAVLAAEVA
jgi:hypothetical protein